MTIGIVRFASQLGIEQCPNCQAVKFCWDIVAVKVQKRAPVPSVETAVTEAVAAIIERQARMEVPADAP